VDGDGGKKKKQNVEVRNKLKSLKQAIAGNAAAEEKDSTTAENKNEVDVVASPGEVIQLKKF